MTYFEIQRTTYDAFVRDTNAPDATVSFVIRRGRGWELDGQLINGSWSIEPYDDSAAAQRAERNFGA